MMRSLYNIDLSILSGDPFKGNMSASTTFRVSKIDKNTTTRDIVSCLANLVDPTINSSSTTATRDASSGAANNPSSPPGKVLYELIWVNDETFLVSTRLPDSTWLTNSDKLKNWLESEDDTVSLVKTPHLVEQESVLKRHSELIYAALVKRFASQEISTLQEFLKPQQGMKRKIKADEDDSMKGLRPNGGRWRGFVHGLRKMIPLLSADDETENSSQKKQRVE